MSFEAQGIALFSCCWRIASTEGVPLAAAGVGFFSSVLAVFSGALGFVVVVAFGSAIATAAVFAGVGSAALGAGSLERTFALAVVGAVVDVVPAPVVGGAATASAFTDFTVAATASALLAPDVLGRAATANPTALSDDVAAVPAPPTEAASEVVTAVCGRDAVAFACWDHAAPAHARATTPMPTITNVAP